MKLQKLLILKKSMKISAHFCIVSVYFIDQPFQNWRIQIYIPQTQEQLSFAIEKEDLIEINQLSKVLYFQQLFQYQKAAGTKLTARSYSSHIQDFQTNRSQAKSIKTYLDKSVVSKDSKSNYSRSSTKKLKRKMSMPSKSNFGGVQ